MDDRQGFHSIPKIDTLMELLSDEMQRFPYTLFKTVLQEQTQRIREQVAQGHLKGCNRQQLLESIRAELEKRSKPHLRRVINATGIVLHTNLGRSRLSSACAQAMVQIGCACSNLEYDLDSASRGTRYAHVEELLVQLTGAEAALVVNNNAAAVLLMLDTLTKDKEVIVSRGELVEIGGSFRVPSVMEAGGCRLIEVGTTNKTHPEDYRHAITCETGAILKVHTSNYKIIGFTQDVSIPELSDLATEARLPLLYDMGSGLLADLKRCGIREQETVRDAVEQGADIVTFSGDKLLGGPQAGILVGKRELIDRMKRNHLLRALRIDKLTLAALEATLREYLDEDGAFERIPTLQMLCQSPQEMQQKAEQLMQLVQGDKCLCELVKSTGQVGGGSMPDVTLASTAVALAVEGLSPNQLEERLRQSDPPIISRICENRVWLEMRTVMREEIAEIAQSIQAIAQIPK